MSEPIKKKSHNFFPGRPVRPWPNYEMHIIRKTLDLTPAFRTSSWVQVLALYLMPEKIGNRNPENNKIILFAEKETSWTCQQVRTSEDWKLLDSDLRLLNYCSYPEEKLASFILGNAPWETPECLVSEELTKYKNNKDYIDYSGEQWYVQEVFNLKGLLASEEYVTMAILKSRFGIKRLAWTISSLKENPLFVVSTKNHTQTKFPGINNNLEISLIDFVPEDDRELITEILVANLPILEFAY